MMLKMILPLALAVLLGAPAGAQDAQDPYERFKLFNECRPMGLAFEEEPDLEAVGLTVDRMLSTAESRLRAARLYDAALLHEYPLRVGRRGSHFSGPSAGATLRG